MARYKVLPIDFLDTFKLEYRWDYQKTPTKLELKEYVTNIFLNEWLYTPIPPTFWRDGWYYDRLAKMAWWEVCDTAWHNDGAEDYFNYELTRRNTKWLEKDEIDAIETLMLYGSCTKELKQLLWRHEDNASLRRLQRGFTLSRIQFKKQEETNNERL